MKYPKKYFKTTFSIVLAIIILFSAQTVFASSISGSAGAASGSASSAEDSSAAPKPLAPGESLYTPDFDVQAEGVCIVNEEAGLAVYEKNADKQFVAASLVKLMTCIIAAENIKDLDGTAITAEQWVFEELYGKNASHADIRKGETLTVRELLYAAMLPSANEAALMLAGHISAGNLDAFVAIMNNRAKQMGCTNTVFADPNGLSEKNLITPRDATIIMREFFKNPELVAIASTPSYEMAAHEKHGAPYFITSTNRLISETSPYYKAFPNVAGKIIAGKTGSLGEWQNFVSVAEKDKQRYICAVLHSPDAADQVGAKLEPPQARPALYESAALFDWAFKSLEVRPALNTAQPITEVTVKYSTEADAVRLVPTKDLRTVLPVDAEDSAIEKKFDLPEFLPAPVKQGDVVGSVTLSLEGRVIGTSELIATTDIQRNNTLYALSYVEKFLKSIYLRIAIFALLALVGIYAGVVAYMHNQRQKKKQQTNKRGNVNKWR